MPDLNWNDLRVVLAVARAGTLAGAARGLGIDETTVSRRIAALEGLAGAKLFQRGERGALRPSEAGAAAAEAAERMEQAVDGLRAAVTQAREVISGKVRLTSVPILVSHVLVPAVPQLLRAHSGLQLELIAEARDLSLTAREADMALRLSRPAADAGAAMRARRIGLVRYAAYASAKSEPGEADRLPWIGYEPGMRALPQARWLAAQSRVGALALNDAVAVLQAVRCGLGRSLLPCMVADGDPDLRRLDLRGLPAAPSRELWLLTHPDQRHLARIAAVQAWLEHCLADAGISP